MRTAVFGCGKISDIYYYNMIHNCPHIELVSCASKGGLSAVRQAEKYGILASTVEEILADNTIELIVILTPAYTHYELIKRCLEAGKHVYVEKAFTENYTQAKELIELAKEKRLQLGCAPDTFLGVPFKTIRKTIEDGTIGEITGVTVSHNRNFSEMYEIFDILLQPGGDMASDFAPYYLNALLSLLGPVEYVSGIEKVSRPNRVHKNGEAFIVTNANTVSATLQFKNGVLASLFFAGDSIFPEVPKFIIYGTKGIIFAPDMNRFDGKVVLQKQASDFFSNEPEIELELLPGSLEDGRGLGIDEMADAICNGRTPLASGAMAGHVVEIIEGIAKSSKEHKVYEMQSEF